MNLKPVKGEAMADSWFFKSSDETIGPLTGKEMRKRAKQGLITQETLVTRGGSNRWRPAGRVVGLFDDESGYQQEGSDQSTDFPDVVIEEQSSPNPSQQNDQPKEYKVLTQKDKWFSGKFDPSKLEEALNAYAEQGWIVKAATTATIPGFGSNRDELVVILER